MTTPAPSLSPARIAELTPSCSSTGGDEPCPRPAAWVARYTFTRGVLYGLPPIHDLLCDVHAQEVAVHFATCGECEQWHELRIEPLDRGAR